MSSPARTRALRARSREGDPGAETIRMEQKNLRTIFGNEACPGAWVPFPRRALRGSPGMTARGRAAKRREGPAARTTASKKNRRDAETQRSTARLGAQQTLRLCASAVQLRLWSVRVVGRWCDQQNSCHSRGSGNPERSCVRIGSRCRVPDCAGMTAKGAAVLDKAAARH